jgi:hypothetical protein
MAIDLDFFSAYNFHKTIQEYCEQLDWNANQINNTTATLQFRASSGNTQTVFIVLYNQTIEFSVPSGIKFPSIDSVPGSFSTLLLTLNCKDRVGFWCIEELNNKQVFSIMHNAELSLIDLEYFHLVVSTLVQKCDQVEQIVMKALSV